MRIIDRYVIREVVPPFLLGLLVFTFVLIIPFIIDIAEQMIAKNVPAITILRLAATLLPSSMALTVPMALLIGLLVGLGRLSADREVVVMMACGISPYRMLQPVLVFSVVCWGLTSWLMLKGMPDGNQRYREITQEIVMERAEGEVRPRVFFDDFPNLVLYVHEVPLDGKGWVDVMAADTSNASQPIIYLAKRGRMVIDRKAQTIHMVLEQGARHTTKLDDPAAYEVLNFESTIIALDPSSVFPRTGPARGEREMPIEDLAARAAEMRANGQSPHNPVMEIHKKFSVPIACIVFALLGLALGASHRKDGKLAAFVLGIGVIFAYYVLMFTAEALAKGFWLPAWSAMWVPDIVLGAAGLFLLRRRARSADRPIRISMPAWLRRWTGGDAAGSGTAASSTAPSRRATSRPVVVIRVPHFDLPRPTLLDGYVARQYGRILAMTITGLLGLFYISTFIDKSDKVFKGQTSLGTVMTLLVYMTPQFVYYVIPIAALLSVLVTFGLLSRTGELTVMKACGVSLYRIALPIVLLSLMFSAALFALDQEILARANRVANALDDRIRGRPPKTFNPLNRRWVVAGDGSIYHYGFFDAQRDTLTSLTVYRLAPGAWRLASQTFAASAEFRDGWVAGKGWTQEFTAGPPKWRAFARQQLPLEPPEYFKTEDTEMELMTAAQLRRAVQELSATGANVVPQQVDLHRKLAFPFVTLVMTLLAVPFGVTTGRRGALYGIGLGIVLALSYWFVMSVFVAVGKAGLLPPALAAWTPNIIVSAAAFYLLLKAKT